jgi:hypothetical protein
MSDLGQLFSICCLSWMVCLQPMLLLATGIWIGKMGGLLSALGYLWRGLTTKLGWGAD